MLTDAELATYRAAVEYWDVTRGPAAAVAKLLDHSDAIKARLAECEAIVALARDVADGYPAHKPPCPCSLCQLHAALKEG